MSITKKAAVYSCMTMILLDSMVCISLSNIQNVSIFNKTEINTRSQCWPQIANNIVQYLFGHTAENDDPRSKSTNTAKALARNPCALAEVASHFGVHSLKLIVSKQYVEFLDDQKSCKNPIRTPQGRQSVSYLEGDENSYANLKYNAQHILDRSVDGFILLCSDICISIMLEIAVTLGFGVDIHIWITTTQLTHIHRTIYPKKLCHIHWSRLRKVQWL